MKFITLDFETFFGDDYTLSKLTTEAYVRDPRFEPLIMGYTVSENGLLAAAYLEDSTSAYAVGRKDIQDTLDDLDIENSAVLCHHAHFDGLILSHHFNHRPKIWFDTLSMARAIHGIDVGGSLGKLLDHYKVGIVKDMTAVPSAKGKHLADFTGDELIKYALYCCDDVEGTFRIFTKMLENGFPKKELKHIDLLIRMFTEPELELDEEMLRQYAQDIQVHKTELLLNAEILKDDVMSGERFAAALRAAGVEPPMKVSKKTGKPAYAFAKTDKGLQELAEHEDDHVQALVAARLGNKETTNETKALRMADMATRGPACLYYKYAGAMQTMRVAGGDKLNWQALERVLWEMDEATGVEVLKKGKIRMTLYAPEGYVLVVLDSANIEARVLDTLAGQEDMVEAFRRYDRGEGQDIYCVAASRMYEREITPANKLERQLGKYVILACGYGMGPPKFKETARILSGGKLLLSDDEAKKGVYGYRATHAMVEQLWNRAGSALPMLCSGPDEKDLFLDVHNLLRIEKGGIVLPNGLRIKYPGLAYDRESNGWSFDGGRGEGRTYLYGGKVVENVVQALSKIVVMDQLLEASEECNKRLGLARRLKMTTHDEGGFLVPEQHAEEVLAIGTEAMSKSPLWLPSLPVAAKGAIAVRYGEAK